MTVEPRRAQFWVLVVVALILLGWALRASGAVMVPVVFSLFLALLVAPLDRWVAAKVPKKVNWLGHVAAMGTILLSLLVFMGLIWLAAQQLVERFAMPEGSGSLLPEFGGEDRGDPGASVTSGAGGGPPVSEAPGGVSSGQAPSSSTAEGLFDRFLTTFTGMGDTVLGSLGEWVSGLAMQILSATSTTVGGAVLSFFLTLLMLTEAPKWHQKITSALDAPASRALIKSVSIISDRLRQYLLARTLLGVVTAALYGTWLWLFDVDLLVVWVLLAFLLNYIPTLGSLIAGLLPVAYAFVQKDFGTAMAVGAGIFIIEQVMGNYVDPRVQGRQVSLSSLVVLVALLFWGWIWGIAGLILAVPITIATMIICAHVPSLRPFALMLSNATDMAELHSQTSDSDQ